jgi:hypothetical protein
MKRQPRQINENYYTVKGILKHDVFPELRKHGLLARLNFECCSSCASYALCEDMKKINTQNKRKKKIIGSVFYNRQDEDHFKRTGSVYLKYLSSNEDDDADALAVGMLIQTISNKFKLKVTWDGSPYKAIMVDAPDEK